MQNCLLNSQKVKSRITLCILLTAISALSHQRKEIIKDFSVNFGLEPKPMQQKFSNERLADISDKILRNSLLVKSRHHSKNKALKELFSLQDASNNKFVLPNFSKATIIEIEDVTSPRIKDTFTTQNQVEDTKAPLKSLRRSNLHRNSQNLKFRRAKRWQEKSEQEKCSEFTKTYSTDELEENW